MAYLNQPRALFGINGGLFFSTILLLNTLAGSQATAQPVPVDGVIGRALKALAGQQGDNKGDENTDPVVRTAPPIDPELITFKLSDGSTIAGKLDVTEIQLTTSYGILTIPVSKLVSFSPGLDSRQLLDLKIKELINQVGSQQYNERELAKRELMVLGMSVRDEIRNAVATDKNASRIKELKAILEKIDEEAFEAEQDATPVQPKLSRKDTVVTTKFTATGVISPQEFSILSKFGKLTVKLADIQNATRPLLQAVEITKTVSVSGMYIVQKNQLNTKISVKRGDRITVRADGQITMSPWGSNCHSTPDGNASPCGHYASGIPSGALVGKIGSSGELFLIGSEKTFTAQRNGVLYLAIGMTAGQASSSFPGQYEVKIQLKRD